MLHLKRVKYRLLILVWMLPFFFFNGWSVTVLGDSPIDNVDPIHTKLEATVNFLAGTIGPRSYQHLGNLDASAEFISGSFESFGYAVESQSYEVEGHQVRNIIAERRGHEDPDRVLIIGAHYDTRTETPGADDNASGVAVLLELARLHAQTPFRKTIRFVAFTLEEAPFFRSPQMGSRVYASSLKARGDLVEAMISLEMLGYYSDEADSQSFPFFWLRWWHPSEGNFITVVSNFSSTGLQTRVRDALKSSMSLPVETFTGPWWVPGVDLSDHGSFWNEGYPAVMLTDTAFYRNPHYHEKTDRPETLNYDAMAELVKGVSNVILKLDQLQELQPK